MAASPPGSLIRYRDMVGPRCAMNCGETKQRSAPQSCEDGEKGVQALGDALASGQELISDGVGLPKGRGPEGACKRRNNCVPPAGRGSVALIADPRRIKSGCCRVRTLCCRSDAPTCVDQTWATTAP